MTPAEGVDIEFSRPFSTARLGAEEHRERIEADAAERRALARRFDALAIDHLAADLGIRRVGAGRLFRVEGRMEAEVVQACVVTLEPVRTRLVEDFTLLFGEGARQPAGGVVEVTLDEEVPEPMTGDTIDLGEAVAEQLALALDPYPRLPAAAEKAFAFPGVGPEGKEQALETAKESPFAALAKRKEKR